MKPDENHVREAVERYLSTEYLGLPVAVLEGADPPDYVATVGDRAFNLEVTGIVANLSVGGRVHTEEGVLAGLTKTAESLRAQLEAAPGTSGCYVVHLEPVPHLKREISRLTAACLAYMRETVHRERAPAFRLPFGWEIMKYSDARRSVLYMLGAGDAVWEGQIQEELDLRVAEAVARKQLRAAALGGSWVLALLDRYHVADPGHWLAAIRRAPAHSFSAILLVGPQGRCTSLEGTIAMAELPRAPSLRRATPCRLPE